MKATIRKRGERYELGVYVPRTRMEVKDFSRTISLFDGEAECDRTIIYKGVRLRPKFRLQVSIPLSDDQIRKLTINDQLEFLNRSQRFILK